MKNVTQVTADVRHNFKAQKQVQTLIDGNLHQSNIVLESEVQNELWDQWHLAQSEVRADEISES